jgi:hypothetical protein
MSTDQPVVSNDFFDDRRIDVCSVLWANQCDQIGRKFAIWSIFLDFRRIFSYKKRPMIWAQFFPKKSPKFTFIGYF